MSRELWIGLSKCAGAAQQGYGKRSVQDAVHGNTFGYRYCWRLPVHRNGLWPR
jgi:hypothetical protein